MVLEEKIFTYGFSQFLHNLPGKRFCYSFESINLNTLHSRMLSSKFFQVWIWHNIIHVLHIHFCFDMYYLYLGRGLNLHMYKPDYPFSTQGNFETCLAENIPTGSGEMWKDCYLFNEECTVLLLSICTVGVGRIFLQLNWVWINTCETERNPLLFDDAFSLAWN